MLDLALAGLTVQMRFSPWLRTTLTLEARWRAFRLPGKCFLSMVNML